MKISRRFASLSLALSLSPLLAHAEESFEDPNAAKALNHYTELLVKNGEAGSNRVTLQGTALTFLPLGPQRLLVFRERPAAPRCYDALEVTVPDQKTVRLGAVLPEVHFCSQTAIEHVSANTFAAMNRS
jgi:hypothetical protein